MDFAAYYEGTAYDGRPWFAPDGNAYQVWDRPRGYVAVREDNRALFYRVSRSQRGDFKRWAANAFTGMNCNRLTGAWPDYQVVSA